MNDLIKERLASLPTTPGVYFHKDSAGEVIYIGKAANLRSRVRQYFQKSRYRDPKTDVLVNEIADIDWRELDSEADALFLEAELVRRNQPRFNILLRDDKSLQFVRIDYKSDYPTVALVRRPMDDGAEYFGPYVNGLAIKKALRYLRRAFPYAISRPTGAQRANLYYHLGLDPGLEDGSTSLQQYRSNLRKLMQYLRGERVALVRDIEREMKKAAKQRDFEKAARVRNQLFSLQELNRQILFSDKELMDAALDDALFGLANLLGLNALEPQASNVDGVQDANAEVAGASVRKLRRIEGFDISHMQGTDTVASMVVFTNGVPDKTAYRKFKMRIPGNDDFAHMSEVVKRRLREENRKKWEVGDLMLIDGGKGQLRAALDARDESGQAGIPMIGLAKHREEIIIHKSRSTGGTDITRISQDARDLGAYVVDSQDFISVTLPSNSPIVKLLQRIRDESHRFAVSYHTTLKRGRVAGSLLDDIPGVGPATRKKLLRHFGSMRALANADQIEINKVVGPSKGEVLAKYIASHKS
ncbi:MAG: putative excinuclease subunit domain protein [Candidatus Saccharibacteria bacterium]|nr:putative excinuclease subunit domain protein [Candidatus Saccharibacteria bacterium]